jgi:hypothetical protein
LYQLKAYTAAIGFVAGDESIVYIQLSHLVQLIEKYSHCYKLAIAQDKCFAGKFLNVIDTRFNLFLDDCCKSLDRKDVNNLMIEFGTIHDNVIFNKFKVPSLPASFCRQNQISRRGQCKG